MIDSESWPRIIAHMDMDAFFSSIEQRDFPELQGKPVAVTNGEQGTCIITRSYEARRDGIKTGMRLKEALQLCPDLIQRPSRPEVYARVSTEILAALEDITPDIEIFSVDEAFLELTHCRPLYHSIEEVGIKIRRCVHEVSGLVCSVGMSGDKTTAKIASKLKKPNGFVIITPAEAEAVLAPMPVTALCGVANGVGGFLAQHGVYRCADMKKIPIGVLARRFGGIGRRIWLMAQGKDPAPLVQDVSEPKSMGHGKIIPPNTKDKTTLLFFLNHMSEKVAFRLRRHDLQAQRFFVGLRADIGWLALKGRTILPTNDGHDIFKIARQLIEAKWSGEGIHQCQITALDPQPAELQQDLFSQGNVNQDKINQVTDRINARYGQGCLTNGIRLADLNMPDVIAPA